MMALVYIALCLIWGSTWGAIKIGLQDAPPLWSAAVRIMLAGIILAIYNLMAGNRYPSGWKRRLRVAWPGLFTFALSYLLVYAGNQHVSSALASIMFATFPFFVLMLVPVVVKTERVAPRSIIGALIGFGGIVVIFAGPLSLNADAFWGAGLIVLGTAFAAYGTAFVKGYLADEPVAPMLALQMSASGLIMLLAAALFDDLSGLRWSAVSIGSILYLAVFGSVLTFGGYFWLLKKISAVRISMIALVTPLIAIFLGYLALGEALTGWDYVGSALVLGGVLWVNIKR